MNGPKDTYDRTIDLVDVATGKLTHNVTEHARRRRLRLDARRQELRLRPNGREAKPQLYRYTLATGAIIQLTHFKDGVSEPGVSHDGNRIALTVTERIRSHAAYIDFSKAGFTPTDCAKEHRHPHHRRRSSSKANGQGYIVSRPSAHLDRRCRRLARRASSPRGNMGEGFVAWSPDDRKIMFNSTRYEQRRRRPERRLRSSLRPAADAAKLVVGAYLRTTARSSVRRRQRASTPYAPT